MWDQKPSFRFEIHNFSEKEAVISSNIFVVAGCDWILSVYPKGDGRCDDHLSLYLEVANRKSLRTGWKRCAKYYFVMLNQSDKELFKSSIATESSWFCAKDPSWGFRKTLPLSKFHEKGFLEKDRLIIEVYINDFEAVDGEGGGINGFQGFASHLTSVRKMFAEHVVKTEYKNALSNACSKISELADVGFKLDWLKSKFDEVSLKRKKADDADGSLVQQLKERIKNLELMELGFKMDCSKSNLKEKEKSFDADGSRVQKLEEKVKNIELMELGFKLDSLNSKLEEISLEMKKSFDADESRSQQLEERVKDLELIELRFKLDFLNTKIEKVSLEIKKSDSADESKVQQLEESVKNIELMVSYLKVEVDKKKDKYSADGFLLVD